MDDDVPGVLVVCPLVVLGADVIWLVLAISDKDDLGVELIWPVLLPCVEDDEPGVDVVWLVLLTCDKDDPRVELIWLILLPCVDKDEPRMLVDSPPLVVRPVLVYIVLVGITDVVRVISVVRTGLVVCVDSVETVVIVWPVLIV